MVARFSTGIDQKFTPIVVCREIDFFTGSFFFSTGVIFLLYGYNCQDDNYPRDPTRWM